MAHRVSRQAEADLDVWYYIATESGTIEAADRFIDSLSYRFCLLASHPYIGRARNEEFGAGSRSFTVSDYMILYRVEVRTCGFFAWYVVDAILKPCKGAN